MPRRNEVLERMLANRNEATRRIMFCLTLAERQLGLAPQPDGSLIERIELILGAAGKQGGLGPDLYELCWMLRAAAKRAGAEGADTPAEVA